MPGTPHVVAKRREPNRTFPGYYLTFIDCPHCGQEHIHGDGPGHRVAHCYGPGSDVGYVIDYPSGWEPRSRDHEGPIVTTTPTRDPDRCPSCGAGSSSCDIRRWLSGRRCCPG